MIKSLFAPKGISSPNTPCDVKTFTAIGFCSNHDLPLLWFSHLCKPSPRAPFSSTFSDARPLHHARTHTSRARNRSKNIAHGSSRSKKTDSMNWKKTRKRRDGKRHKPHAAVLTDSGPLTSDISLLPGGPSPRFRPVLTRLGCVVVVCQRAV